MINETLDIDIFYERSFSTEVSSVQMVGTVKLLHSITV